MVKHRCAVALSACALAVLLAPGVAWADRPPYGPPEGASGPPEAGCPDAAGWRLVTPSGPEHLSAAYDFNLDGEVCARWLPALGGSSLIAFMDNVVR